MPGPESPPHIVLQRGGRQFAINDRGYRAELALGASGVRGTEAAPPCNGRANDNQCSSSCLRGDNLFLRGIGR